MYYVDGEECNESLFTPICAGHAKEESVKSILTDDLKVCTSPCVVEQIQQLLLAVATTVLMNNALNYLRPLVGNLRPQIQHGRVRDEQSNLHNHGVRSNPSSMLHLNNPA